MSAGPFIKSLLKSGIENLPEQAIKAQSVPNKLAKLTNPDELKFANLGLPTEGKVTKADLAKAESERQDVFDVVEADGDYKSYSLKAGKNNPTYKEKVYTFRVGKLGESTGPSRDDAERALTRAFENPSRAIEELEPLFGRERAGQINSELVDADGLDYAIAEYAVEGGRLSASPSRFTSSHYPQPDYLFHTRIFDDTWGVNKVRVLQELQSDLHQQGRQSGYDNSRTPISLEDLKFVANYNLAVERGTVDSAMVSRVKAIADQAGYANDTRGLGEIAVEIAVGQDRPNIPISPFEKSWTRKAIEREIASAVGEGRDQLAIPITGPDIKELKRGEGVQKVYETTVLNTAKKIAKSQGMHFEVTTGPATVKTEFKGVSKKVLKESIEKGDWSTARGILQQRQDKGGVISEALESAIKAKDPKLAMEAVLKETEVPNNYAVITFGKKTPQFALYSTPLAGGWAVYEATKSGFSEEETDKYLMDLGYDEADLVEFRQQAEQISQLAATGMPEEEIRARYQAKEPELVGEEATPTAPVDNYWTDSAIVNLKPKYKGMRDMQQQQARQRAFERITSEDELSAQEMLKHAQVINPAMASMATQVSGYFGNEANKRIADEANIAMIQRMTNLLQKKLNKPVEFKNGGYVVITEQGEVPLTTSFWQDFAAVAGETAGGMTGGIAGFRAGMRTPIANPYVKAAVVFGASAIGAAGGSVIGTEVDYLQSSIALSEDLDAQVAAMKALTAVEMSVLADVGIVGAGSAAKLAWKTSVRAKNLLLAGNPEGAARALEESLFITKEESIDAIERLGRLSEAPGKLPEEQAIAATALTRPGMEGLVASATKLDVKASMALSKSIDDRAKDLLEATKSFAPERIPRLIKEDLANYTSDVKQFFHNVKEQAAKSPKASNFEFDYDKLVLEPVLERIEKDLVPGPILEKFSFQARKIRAMSDSRTFTDLLDMRQLVNEFMFNKRLRSAKGFDELVKVRANIDGAINSGAPAAVENPVQWLKDYKLANSQYSDMKALEKNVIVKLMNRPGVSPSLVVDSLTKYITALDGTFNEVMSKLPRNLRPGIEGSVMNTLAEKYTAGLADGVRATHFPMLAEDLSKIAFTTPEMRKLKVAVMEMAQVFRNDIPLSQAAGQITIQGFQSFLTVDPVVRAQFELASSVFNAVRKFKPTAKGRETALVLKVAEVLEKPLNTKSVKQLMIEAEDIVNISVEVQKLASEAAKAKAKGLDKEATKVVLFGEGKILSFKGTGPRTSTPAHRIATHEIVETVAEAEGINLANKKALDQALKARGYSVVQLGTGKVRRIK